MTDKLRFVGSGPQIQDQTRKAAATTRMGRMVYMSGDTYTQAGANANSPLAIAVPDVTRGHDETDEYAANDQITVAYVQPGQVAYARITSTAQLTAGQALKAAGSGALEAHSGSNRLVAILEEDTPANSSDRLSLVRGV